MRRTFGNAAVLAFAVVALAACGSTSRQASDTTSSPATPTSLDTPTSAASGAAQPTDPGVAARLLAASDLPAGWIAAPVADSGSSAPSCLSKSPDPTTGHPQARVVLANKTSSIGVEEQGAQLDPSGGSAAYSQLNQTLQQCANLTISVKGQQLPATIAPTEVAKVGDDTSAFTMTITSANQTASVQIALVRVSDTVLMLIYSQSGTPGQPSQLPAILSAAAAKAGNGTTT